MDLKNLNDQLLQKNAELEKAAKEIELLQDILPICANCKDIRDDKGYWHRVEDYISSHSDLKFTHGICNKCADQLYGNESWYKPGKLSK